MGLHRFDNKKELKKLDFKNNKAKYIKIGTICISFLVVIISIIYFTYSKFTLTDTFKTAESTVDTFVPADYVLDFYIENEKTLDVPANTYDGVVTCENGAIGIWNSATSSVTINTTKKTKCTINLSTLPSEPELYTGLIPIVYDEENNIVVADVNKKWYSYLSHEWANAILVNQSNSTIKNKYVNSDGTFKSGTIVNISDVLQMYVWIPRYRYQLFNVESIENYLHDYNNTKIVNIEFENIDTPKSTGTQNGEWLTHPAFTFGTTELNGIWVGKFESSGSTSEIKIIPNVPSLRNIKVAAMFNASRAIESNSKYKLNSSQVDTHMMKNTEWGAVAFLNNSIYGRFITDNKCILTGCIQWRNNNSNCITGCSGNAFNASKTTDCNQWNTQIGVGASTTGNIYGIYDMSGGAYEYVMGNMLNSSGGFTSNSSGLSQPAAKYYDSYAYSTEYDISRRILGDATAEATKYNFVRHYLGSDYDDYSAWFSRGDSYKYYEESIFMYTSGDGSGGPDTSWRVVLSAQ